MEAGGHLRAARKELVMAARAMLDHAIGTFSRSGSMTVARSFHTATLLANGSVLVAGGVNDSGVLASAELYRP